MPAKETVGDYVVRRLGEWGVKRIYGYPGDGINGVIAGIQRAGEAMEFVEAPHEELCSLMATAHAKYTSELGVCLATQGPGAIHLLNGLYDAKLDHQPVLAIVGQPSGMAMGASSQQEIDLVTLFKDVAHEYVMLATHPAQIRHLIDRAARIALADRTVTCLILPHDLQSQEAVPEPPNEHGAQHSSVGFVRPRVIPTEAELKRAADVLNAGNKVAILVGAGALAATDEVIATAEVLGAGVAKALLGKAVVPDDLPFVTGSVGWLGTQASNDMMADCDTLLMVGSGFPYTEFLPKPGQARGVQIDLDPSMLSLRYPMEVGLVGDAAETLRALQPLLTRKTERTWRTLTEQRVRDWRDELERRAQEPAKPLNPQLVTRELSRRLPDDVIVAGDSGSSTVWLARHLELRRGMLCSLSGTLATMGSALPYGLAAKFAHPSRPVVALSGDGAMQMIGNAGLIAVSRYWRRWRDPRLILVVFNNRDLNYVTWEQRAMEGEPKFPASQDLPDFDYARYAELIGLKGIRIERPDQVGSALDEALRESRPVVIDAVVDPDVPTLPPTMKEKQEKMLDTALRKGDPDRVDVERQVAREDARK